MDETHLVGFERRVLSMTADMTAGSLPSMLGADRLYPQSIMLNGEF